MITLKCECLQQDFDGLSSFILHVCMCICERKMLSVIAHMHPSVCVGIYVKQHVHEYARMCSHREQRALSVESDQAMIGDHWKIELIFEPISLRKCHI